MEIPNELQATEIEDTNMKIMLANKSLRIPMGLVKDASIRIGANIFPMDFFVVDMPADYSCPTIFGRTFLINIGDFINYK
jgi:hypothetical protein